MLLATATVMHRVYTYDDTPLHAVLKGLGLAAFLTVFSVWHCLSDEIVGHSILFGVMVVLVGTKTRSIISHRVEDPAVKKEVRKLVRWGSGMSSLFSWWLGFKSWGDAYGANSDFYLRICHLEYR